MDIKMYGIIGAIIALLGGGYLTNAYVLNPSSQTVKARALKYSYSCNNECEEKFARNKEKRVQCFYECEQHMCKKYGDKLRFCWDLYNWGKRHDCRSQCHKDQSCKEGCIEEFCKRRGGCSKNPRDDYGFRPVWEGATEEFKNQFRRKSPYSLMGW